MLFEDLITASFNKVLRKRVRALYRMFYVDHDRSHETQPVVDIEFEGHFFSIDLSNDNVIVTSDTAPMGLQQQVYKQILEC